MARSPSERRVLNGPGRATVRRLMVRFGLDSAGGGFLSSALIAYWFFQRYGTSEMHLAWLFRSAGAERAVALCRRLIARRIELLNTMVLTHVPSSIFLSWRRARRPPVSPPP